MSPQPYVQVCQKGIQYEIFQKIYNIYFRPLPNENCLIQTSQLPFEVPLLHINLSQPPLIVWNLHPFQPSQKVYFDCTKTTPILYATHYPKKYPLSTLSYNPKITPFSLYDSLNGK